MLDAAFVLSSPGDEALTTDTAEPSHGLIATSPAMMHVWDLMKRAVATNRPVVLVGEANTGKEYIARQIHLARIGEPFVAVEPSLDRPSVDAMLGLGRGTLFVPEIATMSLPLQLKVLRACSPPCGGRTSELRLIATASLDRQRRRKDDPDAVARFRHELYRQREAIIIDVPALRDRRGDIALLARHFLAQVRPNMTMNAAVERELETCDWPDNVAELQRVVTQAALATEGTEVTLDALGDLSRPNSDAIEMAAMTYPEMLEKVRIRAAREYFSLLLAETRGNVTAAATRAGIKRESVHRLLKQVGLSADEFRGY